MQNDGKGCGDHCKTSCEFPLNWPIVSVGCNGSISMRRCSTFIADDAIESKKCQSQN